MKVIILKDIKGLGSIGDVVSVKDGYARNFLLSKGLVKIATTSNLNVIEEEKKRLLRLKEKEKKKFEDLAEKISNASCTISVKTGQDDKLFGAVTAESIARACQTEGINIDKHNIKLEQPIKKLGIYQIPIRLHPEVSATLKVWVVKE